MAPKKDSRKGRKRNVNALQKEARHQEGLTSIRTEYREIQWSGALPPPGAMAAFEQVQPGAADRIIAMAEKAQDHQIRVEQGFLRTRARAAAVGTVAGPVLGVGFLGLSAYLAYLGATAPGIAAVITAIGIAAFRFVWPWVKPGTRKPDEQEQLELDLPEG